MTNSDRTIIHIRQDAGSTRVSGEVEAGQWHLTYPCLTLAVHLEHAATVGASHHTSDEAILHELIVARVSGQHTLVILLGAAVQYEMYSANSPSPYSTQR